jgi:hypothetical protein
MLSNERTICNNIGRNRKPLSCPLEEAMPKYEVDIEGQIFPWDRDSITVPELRDLAGYAADQQMIEINLKDNSEMVLDGDAVVRLKPGHGFAKKVVFKRG